MRALQGILLAAGQSQRFGSDKLQHRLADGTPMVLAAARCLQAVLPHSIAVIRPDAAELATLLQAQGLTLVVNPQATDGMGGSIACAVQASHQASGWVIALGDMPFIQSATIQQVVDGLQQGAVLSAPVYQGQRGHPVGVAAECGDWLAQLSGEQGASRLFQLLPPEKIRLFSVADAGVCRDIDWPHDLDKNTDGNAVLANP